MGRQDFPLNQTGIRQAKTAGEVLARISLQLIMTSPLLRARQTAELIANQHPETPAVQIADWLTERDFGPYEGMKKTDVRRREMNASDCVESLEHLAMRLRPIDKASGAYEHLLIVSHSGVYRCLVERLGYQSTEEQRGLRNAELVSLAREF